uniref:TEA domain-containing protein n=1 Tax=Zea mays TaxID=4577 RepID=A0A804MJ85_MAIZE
MGGQPTPPPNPNHSARTPWWRLAGAPPPPPRSACLHRHPLRSYLPEAPQGGSAPRGSKNLASPFPDLTCRLTDLNRGPDQAESSGSPTASVPGRAEEDSVAGAAPARSAGSVDDAAAVAQKDQGVDKPSSAAAESSKRRKEQEQQQPAVPWAKLLSECSQIKESISRLPLLQRVQSGGRSRSNSNPQCHGRSCSQSAHRPFRRQVRGRGDRGLRRHGLLQRRQHAGRSAARFADEVGAATELTQATSISRRERELLLEDNPSGLTTILKGPLKADYCFSHSHLHLMVTLSRTSPDAKFADAAIEASDGTVYFSDASTPAVPPPDLILWPFVFTFICDNHHFRNSCLYAAIYAKGHKRSRFENQIKQHNDNRAAMAKEIKSTEDEGYDDYSYEVFFRRRLFDFIVMWNATSIRNDIIRHAEENRGLLSASSFDRQLLRKELVRRVKAETRTPTQVASHAQKYFIRLNSGGKDKRRSSIHDITTVNLTDDQPPSPSQSSLITSQSNAPAPAPAAGICQVPLAPDAKRHGAGTLPFSSLNRTSVVPAYRMEFHDQQGLQCGPLHDQLLTSREQLGLLSRSSQTEANPT